MGRQASHPGDEAFNQRASFETPARRSFETDASHPAQRLSCESSNLPWAIIPEDGVEDGEEFSGDGDESDHFGLSGRDETLMEGSEKGVATTCHHGANEESRSDRSTTAGDHALAAPLTGLTGVGRKPGQACDAPPVKRAQLGQFRDEL